MNFKVKTSLLALFGMIVMGCSKNETNNFEKGNGTLIVEFRSVFGDNDLRLNTKEYEEQGGKVTFSRFNYIVSNFVLVGENGEEFVYPKEDSFFLIDEREGNIRAELKNVPAGNYVKIKFGIGLDRETYEGDIERLEKLLLKSEDHDAMWDWQTTPILVMLEGKFKAPDTEEFRKFLLHIGNHDKTFHYGVIDLETEKIELRKDKKSTVHLKANVAKVIDGKNRIDLSTFPYITINPEEATKLFDNILTIFEIEE